MTQAIVLFVLLGTALLVCIILLVRLLIIGSAPVETKTSALHRPVLPQELGTVPVLKSTDPERISRFWVTVAGFREERPDGADSRLLSLEHSQKGVFSIRLSSASSDPADAVLVIPRSFASLDDTNIALAHQLGGRAWGKPPTSGCEENAVLIEDPEGHRIEFLFDCCGVDNASQWEWKAEPTYAEDYGLPSI